MPTALAKLRSANAGAAGGADDLGKLHHALLEADGFQERRSAAQHHDEKEADKLRHEAARHARFEAKRMEEKRKKAELKHTRNLGTFRRLAKTTAALAMLEGFHPPSDEEIKREVALRKAGMDALVAFTRYLGLKDPMKVKELMHKSGKNTDCAAWSVDPRFNIKSADLSDKTGDKLRADRRAKAKAKKLKALRKKHRDFDKEPIEKVQEELRDVFRNYVSKMKFHETGKLLMDSVGCHKLVRDAKLLDNFFTYGDCDTCIAIATKTENEEGHIERVLDFDAFDVFLSKIAAKKFPGAPTGDDAWNALVKHYILPFAVKHERMERRDVLLVDQCMTLIKKHMKMLKAIFTHYCTLRHGGSETWEGVRAMGSTLSPDEYYLFLLNFNVAPELVRKADIMDIFYSGEVELESDPDTQKGEVAFPAFLDLISLTGMAIAKNIPKRMKEGSCSVTELNSARVYANCCDDDLKEMLLTMVKRNFQATHVPYREKAAAFKRFHHTVTLRGHVLDMVSDNRLKRRYLSERRDDRARLLAARDRYLAVDMRSPRKGAAQEPDGVARQTPRDTGPPDGLEEIEAAVMAYARDSRQEKLCEWDLSAALEDELREHDAYAVTSSTSGSSLFEVIRKAAMEAERHSDSPESPGELPRLSKSMPAKSGVRFDILGSMKSIANRTTTLNQQVAHTGNRLTRTAGPTGRKRMDGSREEEQHRIQRGDADSEAFAWSRRYKPVEQTGFSTAFAGSSDLFQTHSFNKDLYLHHLHEDPDEVEIHKIAMGPVPPPWLGFQRLREWVNSKGKLSKLSALFNMLDTDNSGSLSSAEFRELFMNAALFEETRITESLLLEMIKAADVNKDGTVDWDEFHRALNKYAPARTQSKPASKPRFPFNVPGGTQQLTALVTKASSGDVAALRVSTEEAHSSGDLGKLPLARYIAEDETLGRPPPTRGGGERPAVAPPPQLVKPESKAKSPPGKEARVAPQLVRGSVHGKPVAYPPVRKATVAKAHSPTKPRAPKASTVQSLPALDDFERHCERMLTAGARDPGSTALLLAREETCGGGLAETMRGATMRAGSSQQ